jgi:hypothetical protein
MRGRVAVLGALLFACSCRGGCHQPTDSATDPTASAAPSSEIPTGLRVTELARANDRFQGLGLDASYVYFGAILHGWRRVPKAGGPIEIMADTATRGIPDPRRAYFNDFNSVGNAPTRTTDSATESFSINGAGVYRTGSAVKRADHMEQLAPVTQDPSVGNIARSVLIVDDTNIYWIGGGVSALFSVPRAGGPVRKICSVGSGAIVDDLATIGDTLYVIDIDGSISSIKKNGESSLTLLDNISSKLGPNRNAIWAAVDGNDLYIVSDATESMGAAVTPLGGNRIAVNPNASDPVFDSRVVKVALPAR